MRFRYRSGIGVMTIVLLITATGCKESSSPGYDRLKLQLLTEAFDAVRQRNHDLAISRLEKLPPSEFVESMVKRERENLALQTVRDLTKEGKLKDALTACEQGIVDCGRTGRLPDAEASLHALLAIRNFKDGVPYPTASDFKKALDVLPAPVTLGNDAHYVVWLNHRRKELMEQQHAEREARCKESLLSLDKALLTGRAIGDSLSSLRDIAPGHPLLTSLPSKNLRAKDLSVADKERLAMIAYRAELKTVDLDWLPEPPETRAGEILAVAKLLRRGRAIQGLKLLRALARAVPDLDASPLAPVFRSSIEKASPSLAPTDLADLLMTVE